MKKLVRFDESLGVRLELNLLGIHHRARTLIEVIDRASRQDRQLAEKLAPLREYAELGLGGQIVSPRSWNDDPLRWEYREGLLPPEVENAYGKFAYFTHGLTLDEPRPVMIGGQTYIEVDDEAEEKETAS